LMLTEGPISERVRKKDKKLFRWAMRNVFGF